MPKALKTLLDFLPLIAFFLSYRIYGIIPATAVIVVLSLISLAIGYYFERKLLPMPLFTAILLLIFGSITIFTGNPTFIKIKPTIINLLFASILSVGLLFNKIFLKSLLSEQLDLSDKNWIIFSKRWIYFFLFLAVINEIVWRNFSEEFWVSFKVFGLISLTVIFVFMQRSFLLENQKN